MTYGDLKIGDTFERTSSYGHSFYTINSIRTTKKGRLIITAQCKFTGNDGIVKENKNNITNGAVRPETKFYRQ